MACRSWFVQTERKEIILSIRAWESGGKLLRLLVLGLMILLCLGATTFAQRMNNSYKNYIRQYANECLRQMNEHGIPASITMAQGLLESGAGQSSLASVHNNHFGIKCHKTWQGKKTYKSDDLPNECFRSYDSSLDSYTDHSYFLKQTRYQPLYSLKSTNYRGWAKGLQKAGYATDKGYANKLIAIIELYGLYELDKGRYPLWMTGTPPDPVENKRGESIPKRQGFISYGLLYVLAEEGDTYTSIAREMGLKPQKVANYNEAPLDFPLGKGDVVYLQKKNRRATPDYTDHVVQIGDSMHSIAQHYGILINSLYRLNGLDAEEYVPTEGDVLLLR